MCAADAGVCVCLMWDTRRWCRKDAADAGVSAAGVGVSADGAELFAASSDLCAAGAWVHLAGAGRVQLVQGCLHMERCIHD